MAATVFWIDFRATVSRNIFAKLGRLFERLEPKGRVEPGSLWALKLHFGEYGNTAYLQPFFLRPFVERLQALGAKPFLTDTGALYVGRRTNAVDHLATAVRNGFDFAVTTVPVVIADGLRGDSCTPVPVAGRLLSQAWLGNEIVFADGLLALTHVKGHELSGLGGAIKNLGMGCAARRGKLEQHSSIGPRINPEKCTACGRCVPQCAFAAIALGKKEARIDPKLCTGCAHCIAVCPEGAIEVQWNQGAEPVQRRMAEYALAAVAGKPGRALFVNFIKDVSPVCDCYACADLPIVPDIGVLASLDPVAIDQASADLINRWPDKDPARDRLRQIHPKVDWTVQLSHGEEIGLGSRQYELVKVE